MAITLAHIRRLSPLGPIFGKELRSTSRRKRTYVLRFFYLGALLTIMLFFFVVTLHDTGSGGSAVRQSQKLAEMGAVFFGIFAFFTLGSMCVFGPVLTATAVNSERLHKTLPVLLMTPITAWQIVAGKLFSRLLIALTLIGLTLPALSVVRLLGGVETEQIVACLTISVCAVLAAAALGLLFSTLMNRAYSVILLSYSAMAIVYALIPAVIAMIMFTLMRSNSGARFPPGYAFFMNYFNLTNPFFVMGTLVMPRGGMPFKLLPWHYCALVHFTAAILLLLLAGFILRRRARKENDGGAAPLPLPIRPGGFPIVATPALSDAPPLPPALAEPLAQTLPPSGATVADNPVLWRESRRPLFAKRWQALASTIFLIATLLFFYITMAVNDMLDQRELQMPFACIFCGLLTLLACVVSSTAIAQEKESDTWTLLLASPLSATRIVLGKLGGLVRRLMWPSILIVAHFSLFAFGGVLSWLTVAIILYLTFTTSAVWVATGLYYSLRLKTVTFAIILNLCGPVIVYGCVTIALGIAGAILFDTGKGAELVGLYAPYPYMCSAIESFNDRDHNTRAYSTGALPILQHEIWMPIYDNVPVPTFLAAVAILGFAHLLVTALIVTHTIKSFNHIVGRAPQLQPLPPPSENLNPCTA